ncbi:hypothetical protein NHX12_006363 [Muraenolepis orangiensis]|uniref:Uncharacterized protein n=1 Tax=Muraenolepis orangiensis TaxID=630683 RepID=A0A9Q0DUN4_9TELE|nr:hypothetical protein NHX12_006363 [Muraenolepis orangiensis]
MLCVWVLIHKREGAETGRGKGHFDQPWETSEDLHRADVPLPERKGLKTKEESFHCHRFNGCPGSIADGAPSDVAPSDRAPSDGAPSDGAPSDGAPRDGAPSDGAPSNGAPSDGAPSDGAPSDGAPSDGAPSDVAPRDGAPSDGAPSGRAPRAPPTQGSGWWTWAPTLNPDPSRPMEA